MPRNTSQYVVRAVDTVNCQQVYTSEDERLYSVREAREKRTWVKRHLSVPHPVKLTIHKRRLLRHQRGKLVPGQIIFYEESGTEDHVETLLVRSRCAPVS